MHTDIETKMADVIKLVEHSERPISFDTETNGLDWRDCVPIGYVICGVIDDRYVSHYIPTNHTGGGNIQNPQAFVKRLREAFEARVMQKFLTVGHHLKFDMHFAYTDGILLGRSVHCTQNTASMLDEYAKSYSLDNLAKGYDIPAKLGDELYQHIAQQFDVPADRKAMGHFHRLSGNDPLAVEYAEGDGITTLRLYEEQLKQIEAENLGVIVGVENELIYTLFRMERRGIRVDLDRIEKARYEVAERLQLALAELPEGLNVRSPVQVRKYIEQYRTDYPLTEKGNPSFPEEWLSTFPQGQAIVDVRRWTNVDSSTITPIAEVHEWKGRIHPQFNQNRGDEHGTITGRLSCSSPNLQGVPKHNKEIGTIIRRLFIPDEGWMLYEGDWSQAEPRLIAHYSEDETLLNGYNMTPPKDVHTLVAELLNKDRATTAKRMNMGIFTGMYPKAFAGHMGVSIPDATALWNEWHNTFPGVKQFQNKASRVFSQRGYVKTILGRRARLESHRFAYRAPSRIIQGGQADMLKYKMVEIDKYLEAHDDLVHLLIQVHDSLVMQGKDSSEGERVVKTAFDMMADVQGEPFNLKVPFIVDVNKGADWAEASYG